MSCFSNLLKNCAGYNEVLRCVRSGLAPTGVLGLAPVLKAHLIHSLCEDTSRRAVVVLPGEAAAHKLAADINEFCAGGKEALVFPARDYSFNSSQGQSHEFEHQRIKTLCRIINGDYSVIICSAESAMQFTLPPEELKRHCLKLNSETQITPEKLAAALTDMGYSRCDSVEGTGQFAVRGGIIDFFAPNYTQPIRIELWGDSVDALSLFDVSSQRRTDVLDSCEIAPAAEILFDGKDGFAQKLSSFIDNLSGKGSRKAKDSLKTDLEMAQSGIHIGSLDKYLPIAYDRCATIFDYCDADLFFVCETAAVKDSASGFSKSMLNDIKYNFENGTLASGLDRYSLTADEFMALYESRGAFYIDSLPRGSFDTPVKSLITLTTQQLSSWNGSLQTLLDDIQPALSKGVRCIVCAGTPKAAKSLVEALETEDVDAIYLGTLPGEFPLKTVSVIPGTVSSGFTYPGEKFMLFSYGKVAGAPAQKHRKAVKAADAIQSLEELSRGDYVVHSVHGIGIFEGIQSMNVGGLIKDYIKIKYDKGDVLYVPVTQLDLVAKYIGPKEEQRTVKLSRLGGKEWEKAKARVKASAKDMAKELIALYGKRLKTPGFAFSPDIDMQSDFERRFEFEETDDQLRTINEIKLDMQKPHPMDRLLCGDVGFGKTEVALRAAFKCIADGKQCAILVPTTILAFQHYNTILRRFDGFPVTAEMLSRFRTPKEQEKIVKKLKSGAIDIIVGTHRLISSDIKFRDLGLIIIDEEQRFGVGQKEKLKELYPDIDCLTLSATPIPRTMNMALSGIRDMSVIEEAPLDRSPVQTYVVEHDWELLAEAMRKELRRGGQVYYLHNRVETIERTAAMIRDLLPDANVGIGHGKMSEDQLSNVWRSLLEGEIDILVCTTIIETGVDVPNANTLIIEDAQNLGLAQLHQIRGRVGRSSRRGFAYLTFEKNRSLNEIAQKRLEAIREYTEFGSGFKIAMRDLEIRGAGNLLGTQQHGHMESVGYDMYMRLLAEAVSEEKGEKAALPEKECLIDIRIDAHIPDDYIKNLPQRLSIYRRIADIRNEDDASDVLDELIDRFGDPPASVEGLIKISLLRNTAAALNIYEIGQRGDSFLLYSQQINIDEVAHLSRYMHGRILVSAGSKPYITVKRLPKQTPLDVLSEALNIMKSAHKSESGEDGKK